MSTSTEQQATPLFPATPRRRPFTEAERDGIAACIRYGQLPWWERWFEPRPPMWKPPADQYR